MYKEEQLIKSNQIEEIKKIVLNNNNNINSSNGINVKISKTGCTLLHYACLHGNHAIAEYLIEQNADVNVKTKFGVAPIHWAAQHGNKKIFQLLISKNANIKAKTAYGFTPLHYAMLKGSHVSNNQWKAGSDYDFIIKHLLTNGLMLETVTNNQNNCWHFMSKNYISKASSARKMLIVLALDDDSTVDTFTFFEMLIRCNKRKNPDFTVFDTDFNGTPLSLAVENKRPLEIIHKIVNIMYPTPDEYVKITPRKIPPPENDGGSQVQEAATISTLSSSLPTSPVIKEGVNIQNSVHEEESSSKRQKLASGGMKLRFKLTKGKGLFVRRQEKLKNSHKAATEKNHEGSSSSSSSSDESDESEESESEEESESSSSDDAEPEEEEELDSKPVLKSKPKLKLKKTTSEESKLSPLQLFKCEMCPNKKYKSQSGLWYHMKRVHDTNGGDQRKKKKKIKKKNGMVTAIQNAPSSDSASNVIIASISSPQQIVITPTIKKSPSSDTAQIVATTVPLPVTVVDNKQISMENSNQGTSVFANEKMIEPDSNSNNNNNARVAPPILLQKKESNNSVNTSEDVNNQKTIPAVVVNSNGLSIFKTMPLATLPSVVHNKVDNIRPIFPVVTSSTSNNNIINDADGGNSNNNDAVSEADKFNEKMLRLEENKSITDQNKNAYFI